MKVPRQQPVTAVLLVVMLTGCSIDHSSEAADLKSDLSQMAGVKSISHEYEGGSLGGSLSVAVTMHSDASPPHVLAVIATAYDEFNTTYRTEQANLVVHRGPTEILVHTGTEVDFTDILIGGADADIDDILAVTRFALDTPQAGEQIRADMVVEDANQHALTTELRINLEPGSSEDEIIPRLRQLANMSTRPKEADIWVLSADGAGVGGSRGMPTASDLAIWRRLSSYPLEGTVRVEFGPYQMHHDVEKYGFANITVRSPQLPSKAQLNEMKSAHLETLAKRSKTYVYNVTVNGRDAMWLEGTGGRECGMGGCGSPSD